MMLATSVGAALLAGTVNINCGTVVSADPGSETEDRIAALEMQMAALSAQIAPLRSLAEATCETGQTLSWDGANWSCAASYTDQRAVAAVAAADTFVTKAGDNTITGTLTVVGTTTTDALAITSGEARFADTKLRFFRAAFVRSGTIIRLSRDGVVISELDIGDGTQNLQNSHIGYRAGVAGGDARLMFNIDGLSSLRCTLLHSDDDAPQPGIYFATDGGNQHAEVWGNTTTDTFVIARQGVTTHVITGGDGYQIACF